MSHVKLIPTTNRNMHRFKYHVLVINPDGRVVSPCLEYEAFAKIISVIKETPNRDLPWDFKFGERDAAVLRSALAEQLHMLQANRTIMETAKVEVLPPWHRMETGFGIIVEAQINPWGHPVVFHGGTFPPILSWRKGQTALEHDRYLESFQKPLPKMKPQDSSTVNSVW